MFVHIRKFIKSLFYPFYEWRIVRDLDFTKTPHHVGVILDGNRRWAKANRNEDDPTDFGIRNSARGHKAGANKIIEVRVKEAFSEDKAQNIAKGIINSCIQHK